MYTNSPFDRISHVDLGDRGGLDTSFDRPPIIETAEILRVDSVTWVVDVFTKFSARLCRNIEVPGSGVDRKGTMMGYMPQIGDLCLIAHTSDTYIPKIINFIPYVAPRTGARGLRKEMRPGDLIMATSDGNYVHVHKGGVVDISSNPITRRIYVPILNQIKDFCENYILNTAGGAVRWENRREEEGEQGAGTELVYEIKDASESGVVMRVRRGQVSGVDDIDDPVEHKSILNDDGQQTFRFMVGKSGEIKLEAESASESYSGDYSVNAGGDMNLNASGVAALNGDGGVELAQAAESAVLGDTLVQVLTTLSTSLGNLATQLGAAAPQLYTGPAVPGPGQQTFAQGIATFQSDLGKFTQALQNFLARDTTLS